MSSDLISSVPAVPDKMLVRLFTRSAGMIIIHSRMTREEIEKEIWTDEPSKRSGVCVLKGSDEFDNSVDVRFDRLDIVGHTACRLASGAIARVQTELAGGPSVGDRRSR